jgi:hypothetical protein
MRRRRRRRILLVGGLVAFGAYKMSTKDADRIKEHTGTDPEEMTDEELAQSMDELGIEKQQVTDADQEEGGGAAPSAAAPAGQAGKSSGLDDLEQLAKLHEEGILTDEEFTAKKKQILGL